MGATRRRKNVPAVTVRRTVADSTPDSGGSGRSEQDFETASHRGRIHLRNRRALGGLRGFRRRRAFPFAVLRGVFALTVRFFHPLLQGFPLGFAHGFSILQAASGAKCNDGHDLRRTANVEIHLALHRVGGQPHWVPKAFGHEPPRVSGRPGILVDHGDILAGAVDFQNGRILETERDDPVLDASVLESLVQFLCVHARAIRYEEACVRCGFHSFPSPGILVRLAAGEENGNASSEGGQLLHRRGV